MMRSGFPGRRAGWLASLALAAACATAGGSGAGGGGGDDLPPIDPSLGVDVSALHRSPTGLYTRDLAVGTGAAVGTGDLVRVRYTLFLTNGKRIEGTEPGDPPFQFRIKSHDVIAGWDEGVTGMRVGGRRQLIIPPALGYGVHTRGQIPGSSIMVVTIELVEVLH